MKVTLYWGVRLYSNRIIAQDLSYAVKTMEVDNVNFTMNDGINSSLVINFTAADAPSDMYKFPSYLITEDGTDWFITGAIVTRNFQLNLELKRDILSEKWETIEKYPFIAQNITKIPDSLTYARYKKTYNLSQVKQNEDLLTDRANGQGWLIGFIDKDFISHVNDGDDNPNQLTVTYGNNLYNFDYSGSTLADFPYAYKYYVGANNFNYRVQWYYYLVQVNIVTVYSPGSVLNANGNVTFLAGADQTPPAGIGHFDILTSPFATIGIDNRVKRGLIAAGDSLIDSFKNNTGASIDAPKYMDGDSISDRLRDYDGKIFYARSSGLRYKMYYKSEKRYLVGSSANDYDHITNDMATAFSNTSQGSPYLTNLDVASAQNCTAYSGSYIVSWIDFEQITDDTPTVVLKSNRVHTTDALYDIFAIPLGGKLTMQYRPSGQSTPTLLTFNIQTDKTQVMSLLQALYEKLGGGTNGATYLYDVQWLPYGPLGDNDTLSAGVGPGAEYLTVDAGYQFSPITTSFGIGSVLIWLSQSQYQRVITYNGEEKEKLASTNVRRMTNEYCRYQEEINTYRLASPNYASQFEFSPFRNGGLDSFQVSIAYKPYSSYIKVSPTYNNWGLYGNNYNDARGLILSGDFSLDRLSDTWTTYKLQNKNYELIFNRQIQSMDLSNAYQAALETQSMNGAWMNAITGTISGSVTGATGGAITGATVGGPYGAIAGAVVGGVAGGVGSAVGGIADIQNQKANARFAQGLRANNRANAVANYQYQIGNIMAMPDTITKISTFNPDFKVYPILEHYHCTDNEAQNLIYGAEYGGWDVNMMCSLSDLTFGFIKGQLLGYAEGGPSDSDLSEVELQLAIEELSQGVYYKGRTNNEAHPSPATSEEETT